MEDVLNETCTPEDLKLFEQRYQESISRGGDNSATKFDYACFLVRSRYPGDIQKGIVLLEELYRRQDEVGKRDYLFYLALGNARLKEYQSALKYTGGLLQVEPGNRQVQDLETIIKKRMEKEAMKGAAIAGGVLVGIGAVIGGAIALSRR